MNYSLYARGEDAFCGPERETAVGASRSAKGAGRSRRNRMVCVPAVRNGGVFPA